MGDMMNFSPKVKHKIFLSGPNFSNIFNETVWPIKAKLHMEHPCEGGTKVCISSPGHMTKMATLSINGKQTLKILFFRTRSQRILNFT